MSRYYLKSMEIGYEIPVISLDNQMGSEELSRSIAENYMNWFDIIKVGLKLYALPNLNGILLFYLVVRVDSNSIDAKRLETEWNSIKSKISSAIENYLTSNKIIYQKFN